MEKFKIWGVNLSALGISLVNINSILTTLVLLASLVWTIIQINDKINNKK
jgi:hypothetical protein